MQRPDRLNAESTPTKADRRSVLIIAPFFPPWGGGGVLRMTKLVKYLPGLGWNVTVISSDERYPEVVDETLLDEIPPSVRVMRIRGPFRGLGGAATGAVRAGGRRTFLAPLISIAKATARAFLIPDRWIGWALKVGSLPLDTFNRPDIVLSSGPPHSAHLAGSGLARRLGIPHVVDLRDDWGGNPLHAHPAPWHGPIDRLLERRTLRRAARIVTIYETSRATLAKRFPGLATRTVAIPNGFDPADLVGLPSRVPATAGRPVQFLFAGSLRGTQDVGRFFEVFGERARASPATLHLTLLGYVSPQHVAWARDAIPSDALDVQPPVSHRAALEATAAADVLVLFTGGGGAGADTLTGKLFEYLALRRPILLIGPPGPAAELVANSDAGAVGSQDDVRGLEAAVDGASAMAMAQTFPGADQALLDTFHRRQLARRYSDLLAPVVTGFR